MPLIIFKIKHRFRSGYRKRLVLLSRYKCDTRETHRIFHSQIIIELYQKYRTIELDQRGTDLQRRKSRIEETSRWQRRGYRATLKLGILIRAAVRRVNASRFRISDMFCRSLAHSLDTVIVRISRFCLCLFRTFGIYRFRPNTRVDMRAHSIRTMRSSCLSNRSTMPSMSVVFNVCIRVLISSY